MLGGTKEALAQSGALRCLGCGKCTSVCPIAGREAQFSPRLLVEWATSQTDEVEPRLNSAVWACLTCGRCSERCNSGVDFPTFVRRLRMGTGRLTYGSPCSRGAAAQSLAQVVAGRPQQPGQTSWLSPDLKIASTSGVFLFVGCLPYFDLTAKDIGARPLEIARSSIKLLNAMGIEPALLPTEACCGHDLLWTGDLPGFLRLAEHNMGQIMASKPEVIVTPCPECYQTLSVDYPRHLGRLGAEVTHLSSFVAERLSSLPIRRAQNKVITYHDPCRLGRFSGLFDQPRRILSNVPGLKLKEMSRTGAMAGCCGAHAWNNCGAVAKEIQLDRLQESRSTGADILVTACPKCEIHFRCAMSNESFSEADRIEIIDLFSLVAGALE